MIAWPSRRKYCVLSCIHCAAVVLFSLLSLDGKIREFIIADKISVSSKRKKTGGRQCSEILTIKCYLLENDVKEADLVIK